MYRPHSGKEKNKVYVEGRVMAHLKGHDEHNKSSNGSYAQKIIFHPQNGTTMCLFYVRWALKSHYLVNGAILDSIVRLKPTIMRKWHDISPISPYIFWRGWHSANFHVGYSCKRFLEHVIIYIFKKKFDRQIGYFLPFSRQYFSYLALFSIWRNPERSSSKMFLGLKFCADYENRSHFSDILTV